MEAISLGRDSAKMSAAARPFLVIFAERYSPFGVVTLSRFPTSMPVFLAKACAAGGGQPLAIQQVNQAALQFLLRGRNHTRGNFFATDLQQKVRHALFLLSEI